MTGDAHWSLGVLLLVGLLGVVLLFAVGWLRGRHLSAARRTLTCPTTRRLVDCVVVQDVATGRYTGVRDCSLFEELGSGCARACVAHLNGDDARRPS